MEGYLSHFFDRLWHWAVTVFRFAIDAGLGHNRHRERGYNWSTDLSQVMYAVKKMEQETAWE